MIELTIGNSGATAFQTGDNMPFIIYNNNHSGSILLLHFFCCSCILIARSICVYKPTHYIHSLNGQWSIDSAHRKNGSMSRQPRRRIYVCIVVDTENVFVVAIHSHKMRSWFFFFGIPATITWDTIIIGATIRRRGEGRMHCMLASMSTKFVSSMYVILL